MAVSVSSSSDGRLVPDSPRQGTQRPRTASGDGRHGNGLRWRIRALAGIWEELKGLDAPPRHCVGRADLAGTSSWLSGGKCVERELFKPYRAPEPHIEPPPPSYDESVADLPPDYTDTNALAAVSFATLPLEGSLAERKQEQTTRAGVFGQDAKVDLSHVEGIRSHANKKAKKAAKAAQQAKWAGSDDEEKKDGEGGENPDGDGAGGGDAGGGAGGDGGDPPGGGDGGDGGGEDGDDWFGNMKKKDVRRSTLDKLRGGWQCSSQLARTRLDRRTSHTCTRPMLTYSTEEEEEEERLGT